MQTPLVCALHLALQAKSLMYRLKKEMLLHENCYVYIYIASSLLNTSLNGNNYVN